MRANGPFKIGCAAAQELMEHWRTHEHTTPTCWNTCSIPIHLALLSQAASGSEEKRPRADSEEMRRHKTLWTNPLSMAAHADRSSAACCQGLRVFDMSLNEIVSPAFAHVSMSSVQATPFGAALKSNPRMVQSLQHASGWTQRPIRACNLRQAAAGSGAFSCWGSLARAPSSVASAAPAAASMRSGSPSNSTKSNS